MLIPIEKIGHTLVGFATNYQGRASAAIVIKERKHINVHLKLILVKINIVV